MSRTKEDDRVLELVLEAQGGSREAFGELVLRHQGPVTSIALSRTGDLQRSEDIAQQAFLVAWQRLAELDEPATFGAWLRSITRNIALNSNRKTGAPHHRPGSEVASELGVVDLTPEEASSLEEQRALLWRCLTSIPEEYRDALVLFYRQDKSVAEVARQLDISEVAAKKRLSRGREMIKGDVAEFVEDILGSTQPGGSFLNGVLAALPSTAAALASKGGAKVVAKKAATNVALAGSSWSMWLGLYGLIFGMGTAVHNVGATVVKNQLHRFARAASFVTAIVATIALALYAIEGDAVLAQMRNVAFVYAGALVVLTIYFIVRQRRLDRRHGRVRARFEVEDIRPATADDYKRALSAAALSGWSWLFFASFASADYLTFAVGLLAMLSVNALRRRRSTRVRSVPAQMRFQAVNFVLHVALSVVVFTLAGLLGSETRVPGVPGWQLSLLVLGFALVAGASTWGAAKKFETQGSIDAAPIR